MSGQNRSSAVMAQRAEPHDSLDFFPTPAWATRALCLALLPTFDLKRRRVWEPACGEGHMARPLAEYFELVHASDVHPYGFGGVWDFLFPGDQPAFDWIITNPPFRLGAEFAHRAIDSAQEGVALLVRTAFLEGGDRFASLFNRRRPHTILQFTERVPMLKGRVDKEASTATAYCWIVWITKPPHRPSPSGTTVFNWIPPCRRQLERAEDYR